MDKKSCFGVPGRDGHLPADANIWRKGVVYTRTSYPPEHLTGESGYRVSAAFKCGPAASKAGFKALYRRVRSLAEQAISEVKCPNARRPVSKILCHGWRTIEEANISGAFIMLDLRCRPRDYHEQALESELSDQDFATSGGSRLEEVERLNPQRAEEFYNEFDFTGFPTRESDSVTASDFVTMSYGERISVFSPLDFEPFVRRAETGGALLRLSPRPGRNTDSTLKSHP